MVVTDVNTRSATLRPNITARDTIIRHGHCVFAIVIVAWLNWLTIWRVEVPFSSLLS